MHKLFGWFYGIATLFGWFNAVVSLYFFVNNISGHVNPFLTTTWDSDLSDKIKWEFF